MRVREVPRRSAVWIGGFINREGYGGFFVQGLGAECAFCFPHHPIFDLHVNKFLIRGAKHILPRSIGLLTPSDNRSCGDPFFPPEDALGSGADCSISSLN